MAEIFQHEIVEVNDVWRWKQNLLMQWLFDHAPFNMPSNAEAPDVRKSSHRGSLDLNLLRIDLKNSMFSMEEYMKFHMQIGYSLSGFCELFEPFDNIILLHKGKILKL